MGLLLTTQAAVPKFNPTGWEHHPYRLGRMSFPNAAVYSATKGTVDSITVSLSKELEPKDIRVNALNPGLIVTEGVGSGYCR